MSDTATPTLPHDAQLAKRNRRTLLAIFFVSVVPIVAAYVAFYTGLGVPENTVNNGVLLTKPLDIKQLVAGDDDPFAVHVREQKKWRLLIPTYQDCGSACEDILFTTRQVHIRLGEKSERVERVLVNLSGAAGQRWVEQKIADHPRLHTIDLPFNAWQVWIAESGVPLNIEQQPYYLLVDQRGFAMMAYTTEHGNLLLKDLKRALKYSIDYQ